ncbi:MAG: Pyruvate phosphate dikinase, AMP/ATP-binding domain [Candidatus Woesearchaeota archaeon]|nr:Pyruvate phosphate dikinase, AMP/ATP-binding domain [Candidatus Woesearchaeota archaeon]MDN5327655.1 Pyruvate phosphate dikinase, AMP/ATP-binding domain [Candidatus Woesearchaeota archaeon]
MIPKEYTCISCFKFRYEKLNYENLNRIKNNCKNKNKNKKFYILKKECESMANIISLNKSAEFDVRLVGEKAKNLASISEDFPVPEAFVLPYDFINETLRNSTYNYEEQTVEINKQTIDELEGIFSALKVSNLNDLSSNPEKIELVVRPSCYPSELNEKVPTVINISSFEDLISFISKELFVFSTENCKGGIIIQKLIKPLVSGFVTISETNIAIKTNFGFSKSIKEGYYDTIVFDRLSKDYTKEIGNKQTAYIFDKETNNIEQKEVPDSKRSEFVISDENITKIIQNALYLSSRGFNWFEFALADNKMYILSIKKGLETYINEKKTEHEDNSEDDFLDLLSTDLFNESNEPQNLQKEESQLSGLDIEIIEFDDNSEKESTNDEVKEIFEEIKTAEIEAESLVNYLNNKKFESNEILTILDSLIKKYSIINPELKAPLELLKEDLIKELNSLKK